MAQMNVGTAKAVGPDRRGRTKVDADMTLGEREFSLSFDLPSGFGSQHVRLWENGTPVGSGTARLLPAGRGSKPRIAIMISGYAQVSLELAPKLPYQDDQEYTVYAVSAPVLQPQKQLKAVTPKSPAAAVAVVKRLETGHAITTPPTNALQNTNQTKKEIPTMPSQANAKMPKMKIATGYKATPPDPLADVKQALLVTAASLDRLAMSGQKSADGRKEKIGQLQRARSGIKALLDAVDEHINAESKASFWGGK